MGEIGGCTARSCAHRGGQPRSPRALAGALALGLAALVATTAAVSAPTPSSRDTNRVVEYYYGDNERPVLMQLQFCRGVHDSGPEQYECRGPLRESEIRPGMRVYIWMKYLVPRQATPTIRLLVDHEGAPRARWSRALEGAMRYRTWHAVPFHRPGRWRIEVYHADAPGDDARLFSRTLRVD